MDRCCFHPSTALYGKMSGCAVIICRAWVLAWSCQVVFSDNAASFAALKDLTEQRAALAARREELEERFAAKTHACQVGAKTSRQPGARE